MTIMGTVRAMTVTLLFNQRGGPENEAQEQGARIPHEYAGGMKVVAEKGEGGADQERHEQARGDASALKGDGEYGQGTDADQPGGEAVQAVGKIDGIHDAGDPERGDDNGEAANIQGTAERLHNDVASKPPEVEGAAEEQFQR